jgi:predicted membrane protein
MLPPGSYRRRHYHRGPSSIFGGLVLLIVGLVLLLDRLDIVEAREIFNFWPLLVVAAGLSWLAKAMSTIGRLIGCLVIAAGVLLQARNLGYLYIRGDIIWPLILIGIGVLLVGRALESHGVPPNGAPKFQRGFSFRSGQMLGSALFSGIERRIDSQDFEGGKISAVFGGIDLDLRGADIKGNEAHLKAEAVFGGIEIRVPESWEVVLRGDGVFGGVNDETRHPDPHATPAPKRLTIHAAAVFGGIVVNNNSRNRW